MKTIFTSLAVLALMTAPSFAFVGCVTIPTLDNAPVDRIGYNPGGRNGSHGYTGVPGQNGCPIKAAVGTCVTANASLSEPVAGANYPYVTNDGVVPDNHRKTLFGWPVGPVLPNPCP